MTSVLDNAVPFAFAFDVRGHLALTEAGPNAVATFALNRSGALGAPLAQAPTGQAATCWIVADGTRFYVSNAGSGTVSAYEDTGDGALKPLGTTATHAGTVDAATSGDGRFLYVQTGTAGIVDAFRVGADGSLNSIGSVTVPGSIGSDGIAAS